MLIGDMDITRLWIHVKQVKEEKLGDRQDIKKKRSNTSGNEFGQHKSNVSWSSFQQKENGPIPSSSIAQHPGTNMSTIVRIHGNSELDLPILKVVWKKR